MTATLENWSEAPHNRWSFLHLDELIPTAPIPAATSWSPLAWRAGEDVLSIATPRHDAVGEVVGTGTVGAVVEATWTDGLVVLHRGDIVAEEYHGEMTPQTRHLLMSLTKTVVGVVVTSLADEGLFRLDDPVEAVLPELSASGFAGATVRHLLDMRSGVRFSETYHDPDADVYRMEHAAGWRPARPDVPASLQAFLRTLPRERDHGDRFSYRSSETNVLGWVCERATGTSLADLVSERVWQPVGAESDASITLDPAGVAVGDGGMSATLRDTARFAELLRANGRTADGRQVTPPWFVTDTLLAGDDCKRAFARSSSPTGMPGGHYRNQVWVPFPGRSVLLGLGIHGQLLYVNQRSGVTGVKLSAWPTAQDPVAYYDTLGAFESISRALAPEAHS
ncbi:serine hydrolase [Intrasporangium sp.]|uniref:serine hydrolase domain-containing protein n=1 Tax=Intrasporangium sp. TaxID=1925024 RepID=UPI00322142CB